MMLPKSRKEAIDQGTTYYFSGKECPNGHTCMRFASNWGCVECLKESSIKNKDSKNTKQRETRRERVSTQEGRDEENRKTREYNSRPAVRKRINERARITQAERRKDPAFREGVNKFRRDKRANDEEYRQKVNADLRNKRRECPDTAAAHALGVMERKKHVSRATLPYEKHDRICRKLRADMKREARRLTDLGTEHHLDHEIPLIGEYDGKPSASGLHTHRNLRVITGKDNMTKGNTWNPMTEIIMHKHDDGTYTQEVVLG